MTTAAPIAAVTRTRGVLLALMLAMGSFATGQGMAVPTVPSVAADLGVGLSAATWLLSANLAVTAISLPLVGRLGDMYGRWPTILVTLSLVAFGGVLAATAHGLGAVIVGRAIQGVGGGVFSLAFGLAREVLPEAERSRAIGVLAATIGFGGAVGLPLGGALLDATSYRWLFLTTGLMAAAGLLAVLIAVPRTRMRTPARLDGPGMVALSTAVALPLLAIGWLDDRGWADAWTLGFAAGAVVAVPAMVAIERRTRAPLVDVRLAAHPQLMLTNAVTLCTGLVNFGAMVGVTQIAQAAGDGLAVDATRAGLLLLPGSAAMIVVGAAAGALLRRVGNRRLLVGGCLVTAAGFGWLAGLHAAQWTIAAGVVLVFAGISLTLAASANLILDVAPVRQTGEATGLNGLFRLFGAAAGAQVAVAILTHGSSAFVVTSAAVVQTFTVLGMLSLGSAGLALFLPRSVEGRS
jgi:MFS family permease